jgi:hypothetical protein
MSIDHSMMEKIDKALASKVKSNAATPADIAEYLKL